MTKGFFIVLEGPDGAGTSTHSALLVERFQKDGWNVIRTGEPTDGPIGIFIRRILAGHERVPSHVLQLLFSADRAWHLHEIIEPALASGRTVICDRYIPSTIAYGIATGLDAIWLAHVNELFRKPDYLLYLLPPLEECLRRLSSRPGKDIFEVRSLQERVHAAYATIIAQDSSSAVFDTSGTKECVSTLLWNELMQRIAMVSSS